MIGSNWIFLYILFISNQNQIIYNTYKIQFYEPMRCRCEAWGGLISRDIIPHKGTRFYSPVDHMARFAWAVSGFLRPLSWWLIGFRVPVIAGNVCLLSFFWRSSSTVVVLRSTWSVWFETYRGAPAIILNVLDWNLWMMLTFDLLEQPHNSVP